MKILFPEFPREPKDYDYLADTKIEKADTCILKNKSLCALLANSTISPNFLYTLKLSHIFLAD